jgi:hypothetical protein
MLSAFNSLYMVIVPRQMSCVRTYLEQLGVYPDAL